MIKKGVFYLLLPFIYLLSLLPFGVLYIIADLLSFLLYSVFGYRKKVVIDNLTQTFPRYDKIKINQIAKKYYSHLSDLIVESIKMMSISSSSINKRVVLENPELLNHYYKDGKSIIAVIGHYGNWEWGGLAISLRLKHKILGVYKPLSNLNWDNFLKKTRSRFGLLPVSMKNTIRELTRHKNEPILLALIADQTPTKSESIFFTNFMNRSTPVFLGTEKIAQLTNYPVVYCNMKKIKRGYYSVKFELLFEEPATSTEHEITIAHTKYLESIIRNQPEYWLWSHRRWKHSPN